MKQRMSNAKFRSIVLTTLSIVLAFCLIANDTANTYAPSIDFALGRGERIVEADGNIDDKLTTYYSEDYATARDSQAAAAQLVREVEEEGAVLLKNENNALPLAAGSAVTPIGYAYWAPFYGGSGSANMDTTDDYIVTPQEAMAPRFVIADAVNSQLKAAEPHVMVYPDDNDPTNLAELPVTAYDGLEEAAAGTTAVVFIGRSGMEGYDANSRAAYEDGTRTQMELSVDELAGVEWAKAHCDKVVVILNTPTPIAVSALQKDAGIDAILWIGMPGAAGFEAMAEILAGEINPSGKTADLWYADFESDPTFINRIATAYTNMEDGPKSFIEYEEGIYMGYRYYETRYAEDNAFPVFGETKGYDEAVVYPFGFGLNYEDDKVTQVLDAVTEADGVVTVTGKITNDSSREVKEVVQIYYGAPYTKGGIEKSAKELVAFTKVTVAAGKTEPFTVTFNMEDMASYDYKRLYSATGSYVLESGDYVVYLGKDSHDAWGESVINVPEALVYADAATSGKAVGKRSSDEVTAVNLFEELNQYEASGDMTTMSRADFAGTFPTTPVAKDLNETAKAQALGFDYANDPRLGDVPGSLIYRSDFPTSNANNGLSVSALRGLDYNDELWDALLDNLDFSSADISELITHGLYQTAPVEAIGLVRTSDHDGSTGFTATWGGNNDLAAMFGMTSMPVEASCAYPCGSVQAATWNTDLLYRLGEAIGAESLTNNINGWYAPGMDLHRTPFGGRNFEYFSEDPVLSGYACSAVISGAFTRGGVFAYVKHFVLNETDDDRSSVAIWTNEQVLRQMYMKAFEIALKTAHGTERYYDVASGEQKTIEVSAARALMTSMNYVGPYSPTNSYTMLTEVLRNEWGFVGAVITDFTSGTFKRPDMGYRYGNDIWMAMRTTELDTSSATAQWAIRNAVHNLAYVIVNSNAYNHVAPGLKVSYTTSPWRIALDRALIGLGVVGLLCLVWVVLRQLDDKKHPNKYQH